jgi:hypothetical protein
MRRPPAGSLSAKGFRGLEALKELGVVDIQGVRSSGFSETPEKGAFEKTWFYIDIFR